MRTNLFPGTLIAICFMLFLTGCVDSPVSEDQHPVSQVIKRSFLSEAYIKQMFALSHSHKITDSEQLSSRAMERKKHLIPTSKFFSAKQLAKRKQSHMLAYKGKGSVDLRQYDSPVENQWDGTCTAHGLRNVIDNAGRVQVSTRHVWDKYQVYSCEDAINAWSGGTCVTNVSSWPHDSVTPTSAKYLEPLNCNTFLRASTYIDDDLDKMREALDNNHPVYLGITVTNSMMNCDAMLVPTSKATTGGHALAIVGYKDDPAIKGGGYFIIKNSWGTDCGDKGYQYVPFYYCTRKDMYCVFWTIDKVETNSTTPVVTPTPSDVSTCLEWERIWYKPWDKKCVKWSTEINVLNKD